MTPADAHHRGDELASGDRLPVTVSADFVERTVARILADRVELERHAALLETVTLPPAVLAAYRVPEPSAGFVARTLRALPRPARPRLLQRPAVRWALPLAAAAAAAVLWVTSLPDRAPPAPAAATPAALVLEAAHYAPFPWLTAFARDGAGQLADPPLPAPDPLLLLVLARSR
jgi:hypothetical protein